MSRYDEIQEIKDILHDIEGVNYGRVMALDLYNERLLYLFKIILDTIFFEYNLKFNKKHSSHLIYYNTYYKRSDYDEIINNYKKIIQDYDEILIVRNVSLLGLFKRIFSFFIFYKQYKNYNLRLIDKIKVSMLMIKYQVINNKITSYLEENSYDLCTTFCDAHSTDNLITQVCKKRNLTTITLQHGQYRYLKRGNETPDCEAYENFISDYLLCWGQATIDEFKKAGIDEERLIKVGALKKFSLNKRIESLQEKRNVFGVILNGETYQSSNIKMLNIAKQISDKLNMDYIVRLHPKNNLNFYKNYIHKSKNVKIVRVEDSRDYIESVDFSLIHMTGVYLELLSYCKPFFVLEDEYTEDIFLFPQVSFKDMEEFYNKYNYFILNGEKSFNELYNMYKYFNHTGDIKLNYKNALTYIVSQKR